jgi:hypothetical protein
MQCQAASLHIRILVLHGRAPSGPTPYARLLATRPAIPHSQSRTYADAHVPTRPHMHFIAPRAREYYGAAAVVGSVVRGRLTSAYVWRRCPVRLAYRLCFGAAAVCLDGDVDEYAIVTCLSVRRLPCSASSVRACAPKNTHGAPLGWSYDT